MRIGGIFKPNALLGSFLVGDGFFLSHFDNPLPVAVLLRHDRRARRRRHQPRSTPALTRLPEPQDPDPGPVREVPAGPGQPAARAGLRPAGPGRRHRPHRHRQHAHAVGVRAHPRDRPPAGRRDETPPGAGDDPLGVGHPRRCSAPSSASSSAPPSASPSPPRSSSRGSPTSSSRCRAWSCSWSSPALLGLGRGHLAGPAGGQARRAGGHRRRVTAHRWHARNHDRANAVGAGAATHGQRRRTPD